MAEYLDNTDLTRSRNLTTYLRQNKATSGTTPSASTLDEIIQGELDAASRRQLARRGQDLQNSQFAARMAQDEKNRSSSQLGGVANTAAQLYTMDKYIDSQAKNPNQPGMVMGAINKMGEKGGQALDYLFPGRTMDRASISNVDTSPALSPTMSAYGGSAGSDPIPLTNVPLKPTSYEGYINAPQGDTMSLDALWSYLGF
jgi:hypothetical protein